MCGFLKLRIQKTLDIYHDQRIKDIAKICVFVCVCICADPLCAHQIFKNGGGLTGPQICEEGCWERGRDDFFQGGGLQFSHKK